MIADDDDAACDRDDCGDCDADCALWLFGLRSVAFSFFSAAAYIVLAW